ncbi:MAG: hypothetical protein DI625_14645 [Sphingomonas sp.]|nr:MAG: hypothetical protein DI625_14645 [Sphingomonas sp.]
MDTLLPDIEAFRSAHGLSEWKFGDLALGDRHLVRQLRNGRELRRNTTARVRQFMATYAPSPPRPQRGEAGR